ncbi:hypothetical protein FKM82_008345 [Ascaphus truei]
MYVWIYSEGQQPAAEGEKDGILQRSSTAAEDSSRRRRERRTASCSEARQRQRTAVVAEGEEDHVNGTGAGQEGGREELRCSSGRHWKSENTSVRPLVCVCVYTHTHKRSDRSILTSSVHTHTHTPLSRQITQKSTRPSPTF